MTDNQKEFKELVESVEKLGTFTENDCIYLGLHTFDTLIKVLNNEIYSNNQYSEVLKDILNEISFYHDKKDYELPLLLWRKIEVYINTIDTNDQNPELTQVEKMFIYDVLNKYGIKYVDEIKDIEARAKIGMMNATLDSILYKCSRAKVN